MKRFHDFAATKRISAYVVLHPEKGWVATIRAHHGESMVYAECVAKGVDRVQIGRASGYGYDKLTAAIDEFIIDGYMLTDHCAGRLPLPEGADVFPREFVPPPGYHMANFVSSARRADHGLRPGGPDGWLDCYKQSGLRYLEDLGYDVRQIV